MESYATEIIFNGKAKKFKFKSNEKYISYAWIMLQAGFDSNQNFKVTWFTEFNSGTLKADECLPIFDGMVINIS